ncbi:VirB2 family type IV secretion system major pilin TrwL [Bartonella taylorii]|uniref:VirB2 family type IV secretion system major pilin TrwL n=1 Tax=Bartonella taylorii TaxID=33046 RepID=A0A9Q8YWT5_BARTA|nr:VirB2 family type IV secretion system major pilin TrwL [Bartonella taylorii]USP02373.1 VirB2 family type IV secretion system major pilin TrwL [Bartonella taylorii]
MKQLDNPPLKNNNRIITIATTIITFFTAHPAYAKLENAKKALDALQKDLIDNIIPIAAAVILLCLAIGYAGRYIEKDTFVRWAIGIVIAGSATQLVSMLFKPA